MLAVLRWGNRDEAFGDWSPFAYVPIDPAGNGVFFFPGLRGLPPGATHVWARCHTADFDGHEDASFAIPDRYLPSDTPNESGSRFSVLTDLHLTDKPWKIKQALRSLQTDTVLLLGDATNDGFSVQFDAFLACMEETIPNSTVFPVVGNHDVPRDSSALGDCNAYTSFQKCLLAKAGAKGYQIGSAPDGRAYAVQIGHVDLIGLQCVTSGRRFRFP